MFLLSNESTCSLTSALAQGGTSAFVDDCDAFPASADLDTSRGWCMAIIEDGGVTQADPEIVLLSGRNFTTLLGIAHRGVNGTTQPVSWPIGANITIINDARLWNALSQMYSGYRYGCLGASPGSPSNPGTNNFRFFGNATPSLCTDFGIADGADDGNWDLGPFLSEFVAGDLVRIKYIAVESPGSTSPKLFIRNWARIEFKIDTGGWTDNTGWWECAIDSSYFTIQGDIPDTNAGVQGIALVDLVKLV